jgi:hypothetical protein
VPFQKGRGLLQHRDTCPGLSWFSDWPLRGVITTVRFSRCLKTPRMNLRRTLEHRPVSHFRFCLHC